MDTHLQRPTDTLHFSTTRQQIEALFNVSFLVNKGQYAQAIKHYQDILMQIPKKKYNAYELEVQYNKILAELYLSRQFQVNVQSMIEICYKGIISLLKKLTDQQQNYLIQEQQDQWPQAEDLRIRIYTTMLQLSVKYDNIKLQQWLSDIIRKLKDYPQYLPQVLGKLCGCKYLKEFCQNFNSDQIISQQDKSPSQKAQMIDLASSWLIVGGKYEKGLKFKQQAVNLWKNSNSLKQFKKCQTQFKELKQNKNTIYCVTLKKVARITTKLLKQIQGQGKILTKPPENTGMMVKKSMNKNLQQMQKWNDQLQKMDEELTKKSQNKGFWSSFKKSSNSSSLKKTILKQQSKLTQYYQKSHEFYNQIYSKENNQQITSLMVRRSKYILQQKKFVSKLLVPLIQQYTIRQKYAFNRIKTDYILKIGMMNPQFTKKNSSPQKNLPLQKTQSKINKSNVKMDQEIKRNINLLQGTGKTASKKQVIPSPKKQELKSQKSQKSSNLFKNPSKTPENSQKAVSLKKNPSTQMKKQESDDDEQSQKLNQLLAKFQKKKKKKII